MFIFILLLTSIAADWVEISQFHTERPLRIHQKPSLKVVENNTPFRKYYNENDQVLEEDVTDNPRRVLKKPSLKISENKLPIQTQNDQSMEHTTEISSWTHKPVTLTNQPNRDEITPKQHNKLFSNSTVSGEAAPFLKHNKPSSLKLNENIELTSINKKLSMKSENKSPLREQETSFKQDPNGKLTRKDPGSLFKNNHDNEINASVRRLESDQKKGSLLETELTISDVTKVEERNPDSLDKSILDEDNSKRNSIYINSTLSHNWNKGKINKLPKFGNVQRVNVDSSTFKRSEHILDNFEMQKFTEKEKRKHSYNNNKTEENNNKLPVRKLATPKNKNKNTGELFLPSNLNHDEKTIEIEVLNLSDLEYINDEDIFHNHKTEAGLNKNINKHLIASISTENEEGYEIDEGKTDLVKNKKKEKNEPNHKVVEMTSLENKLKISKIETEKSNIVTVTKPKTISFSHIDIEKNDITNNHTFIKTDIKKNTNNTAEPFNLGSRNEKDKFTLIAYNKTFVPVKRITVPDPEEVMIKEILEAENNIKANINVTKSDAENIKLLNESKITTTSPKLVTNKPSNRKPGIVKKITHPEIGFEDKTTSSVVPNIKQSKNENPLQNRSEKTNVFKTAEFEKSPHNQVRSEVKNSTTIDKELAGIYMNENVEIIRQVQVTSTEEIPIRTTIRIKPLKNLIYPTKVQNFDTQKDRTNPNSFEITTEKGSGSTPALLSTLNSDTHTDKPIQDMEERDVKSKFQSEIKNVISENKGNTDQREEKLKHEKLKFNESVAEDLNAKTMKNLLKFLKVVTETISKNTKQSLKGKLRYLEELRDTLMANIEQRIDMLFPDDSEKGRRRSRSAQARGHHVEFHSSEGALMSISFLTFAVFLIKLVLQLVHTYKSKTMMMPTVVAAVGRTLQKYQHSD